MKQLSFKEALPRLVVAYNKGKLVPFTGAGISAPSIPTWKDFLEAMSKNSNSDFKLRNKKNYSSQELIQASEALVTSLSRESKMRFLKCVKQSLGYDKSNPPITDQCRSLSKIWWPLILSTNYDTMFTEALKENELYGNFDIPVFGRNTIDCHSLLASLQIPSKTLYWALQGYLGKSNNEVNLEDEIVVGYRQYRNATYNNLTFRATFAEIFRNYSLLFIGTGLSEDYFRGLFGEVLEKFGSNPHMHCALFNYKDRKSIDHRFLHKEFNITAIFYKDKKKPYDGLATSLEQLATAINKENYKLFKLGFGNKNLLNLSIDNDSNQLELIAGPMPDPKIDECNIYSAGFNNYYKTVSLSKRGVDFCSSYKSSYGVYDKRKFVQMSSDLIYRYSDSNIYAVVARNADLPNSSHQSRDLRIVSTAVTDLMKVINGKYKVANIMLIAAGKKRTFLPVYSLIQMIRGLKYFLKKNKLKTKLRIYIVDPSVNFYLRTNSLEIEELLNCEDIRLNIEIQDKNEIERHQLYVDLIKPFKSVSEFYNLDERFWDVKIIPAPVKDHVIRVNSTERLDDLGLIPGSMIIYRRRND